MSPLPLDFIDYLCIAAYFAVILAVAIIARAKSLKTYWANDRATGTTMLTLSTVATSVGSGMVFGIVAMAYTGGLIPLFLGIFNATGILAAAVLAPRLRELAEKHSMYSLPDFFGAVYSRRCRLAGAAVNLLVYFFFLSAQLIAIATICKMMTGLPEFVSLGLAFVLLVAYTFIGGMRTDIIADNIQFFILALLLVILPVSIIRDESILKGFHGFSSTYLTGSVMGGWTFILGLLLFFTPLPLVMTDIWMRIYSAKSPQIARRSLIAAALIILPFFATFTLVGMAAYVLFPGISPDTAMTQMIGRYLHPGLRGIAIAGLLAAVMSTADSMLIITGLTMAKDIGATLSPTLAGDERRLFVTARVAGIAIAITALLFALAISDIVQSMVNAFSVLMILLPAVLSGMFAKRKDEAAAFWSILTGLLTTLGLFFVIPKMAFVPGVLVCLITFGAMRLSSRLRIQE
jgi:SSS family solute:Na+ symporter